MANEFKIKNGFFSEGSSNITGSLNVSAGITGSLLGTASYATSALTASYALNAGSTSAVAGTTNYVSKFTSNNSIGNSLIYDDGTNVGIGTTSPDTNLDIIGDSLTVSSESTYAFRVRGGGGGKPITISSDGSYAYIQSWSGGPLQINNQGNDTLLNVGGGSVGIGTTSLSRKLNVAGTIGSIYGSNQGTLWLGDVVQQEASFTSYGILDYTLHNGGGYSHIMRIQGNGNIGIGTTNPDAYPFSAKLSVAGNISVTGTKIGWGITDAFTLNGIDTAHYGLSSNFNLVQLSGYGGVVFATTGTERMRIAGGGNVGIGTTNPSEKLTVNGNIYASQGGLIAYRTDGGTGLDVNGGDLGSGSYIARFKNYSNVDKVVIKGNGNVGVSGEISSNYGSNRGTLWLGEVVLQDASFTSYGVLDYTLHNGGGYSHIMRVQGNGNIGIGTSSPTVKLDTVGYVKDTKYIVNEQEPFTLTVNYSGDVIEGNIHGSVSQWDLVSLDPNGTWYGTDDTTINSTYLLGIYLGNISGDLILLEGHITVNEGIGGSPDIQGLATGIPIYIRDGGVGDMSTTLPTTTGNYVRICGHAYYKSGGASDTYIMKFRPSNDWIQL